MIWIKVAKTIREMEMSGTVSRPLAPQNRARRTLG
jgi:hypothetical protein